MSPMNPRLMRPIANRATLPPYAPVAYTRLWAVTTQASGNIEGSAESDTGYYAVKWWDNSVDVYDSGDPFSKAAAGNPRSFEVYPSDVGGDPSGDFEGFDVSGNDLTQLRADNVTLASSGGAQTGGFLGWGGAWWWGPFFSPIIEEHGNLENNLLTAEAIDQFYTDLDNGTGSLFVAGNPGIDADDPTIATAKGYTVFGGVPPSTALLLNFNGTNGSTTFVDSSPSAATATAFGAAQISSAESRFGGGSLYLDGSPSRVVVSGLPYDYLGPEDFTLECWVRPSSGTGMTLCNTDGHHGLAISLNRYNNDGRVMLFLGDGSRWRRGLLTGDSIAEDAWCHIALVAAGGQLSFYINGVSQTLTSGPEIGGINDFVPRTSGTSLWIGASVYQAEYFSGYIDDFRIVRGKVYTANFTPPAAQLGVYP